MHKFIFNDLFLGDLINLIFKNHKYKTKPIKYKSTPEDDIINHTI